MAAVRVESGEDPSNFGRARTRHAGGSSESPESASLLAPSTSLRLLNL